MKLSSAPVSKCDISILLEELKKITRRVSKNHWCMGEDAKRISPEYKSDTLTGGQPACNKIFIALEGIQKTPFIKR